MGVMPRRSVPFVLPTLVVVALLGAWVGAGAGAVPPVPTLTVPTVTVTVPPLPPAPLPTPLPPPPPPPPPAPVPPNVEAPKVDPPSIEPPVAVTPPALPTGGTSSTSPPVLSGGDASAVSRSAEAEARRKRTPRAGRRPTQAATASAQEVAAAHERSARVRGVTAYVQGTPPEDAGLMATLGAAFDPVDSPEEAIPSALFAMAALAIFLLALASMPPPVRTSRAGALLVHKRGSIALAGGASLVMAVGTYLLL